MQAWPDETELAERLCSQGRLKSSEVDQARLPDGRVSFKRLNALGLLNDRDMLGIYKQATGLQKLTISSVEPTTGSETVNPLFLKDVQALPIGDGVFAVVHPLDCRLLPGLIFATGTTPDLQLIEAGEWRRLANKLFETDLIDDGVGTDSDITTTALLADMDREAPIVRKVSTWLTDAADRGASDVHLEPRQDGFHVRFRIDGVLQDITQEPRSIASSVIARLKVMSGLDLGERNRPQDGRTTLVVRGRRLDVRISIVSTIDGESGVVRLLDRPDNLLDIDGLGFDAPLKSGLNHILGRRQGLFIVSGPTGSGKTTTLYTCLEQFSGTGLKILSVEDPVEYHFSHVNQVQISERAGRDFASSLRAFLRHDPDVIMIGEIRDSETARIAVQAALTGHLVIATLHAIDRERIRPRLLDMGVEAFQLDAALFGVMTQRLVRHLCHECRVKSTAPERFIQTLSNHGVAPETEFFTKRGCPECSYTGYRGRMAVGELDVLDREGFKTSSLIRSGLDLAISGETDLDELIRVELL